MRNSVGDLEPFDEEREQWRVVIETPKSSHNKYKFDEELGLFQLNGVLPEGMSFPYDFGFLPRTIGDDGDPLDVLLLMDEPAFCGCMVPSRLIGVIEAQQTEEDGTSERNDRLVAIPCKARNFERTRSVKDLDPHLMDEIQQFFVSYNRVREKRFKVLGLHGPAKAEALAREGIEQFRKQNGARRSQTHSDNKSSNKDRSKKKAKA
jgi:inorganic pyrophosphatase